MTFSAPFLFALSASLCTALILVLTQRLHGHLTLDNQPGVQKLHTAPTPRVGGLALLVGALAGGLALSAEVQWFWWLICLSALPAFASGLLEDVTKRVGVKTRLLATVFAGMIFCTLTGYRITSVDIIGIDNLLSFWLPSFVFTAFAIGGIANAVNIIDGVNGLAAGTSIIILTGFAVVAGQVGDTIILTACLVGIGALSGFFLLNFPVGRLFLGDAGAYTAGFLLAVIAVALPQRNAELSPLIGLLALSYPVTETAVSVLRRIARKGAHPGAPDRLHLHSLIYRCRARRTARALKAPQLRNAITGLLVMGIPLLSVVLMVLVSHSSALIWVSIAFVGVVYLRFYRKAALLGPFLDTARKMRHTAKEKPS